MDHPPSVEPPEQATDGRPERGPRSRGEDFQRYVVWWSAAAWLVGVILGIVWAATLNAPVARPTAFAIAGSVVTAGAAMGVLLGFIFGLPRALTGDSSPSTSVRSIKGERQALGSSPTRRFIPNTNLEQISDWLTKILVGVGLIEIKSAPAALLAFKDDLKPSLGEGGAMFAAFMTVSSFGLAFFMTYMWTRVRLLEVLEGTEREIDQD